MNLFEKNMESFEKRYPLVAEKIKEIDINNIKTDTERSYDSIYKKRKRNMGYE